MENKNYHQQLGFRCGCKPNNETLVEQLVPNLIGRNKIVVNSYVIIEKLFKRIYKVYIILFF